MPIAHTDITLAEVVMRMRYVDDVLGSKDTANVFHYRRRDFVVAPNKGQLATQFYQVVMLDLLAAMCDAYDVVGVGVRYPNDPDDQEVLFTGTQLQNPFVTTDGALVDDPLPPQNAVTMLLRTGLKGKKHRGSKRFAGASDVHVEQGYLGDTGYALWAAARDNFTTVLTEATTGETWSMCVWNRFDSDMTVIPAQTVQNDVTQVLVNRNIGSQDSRRAASIYS